MAVGSDANGRDETEMDLEAARLIALILEGLTETGTASVDELFAEPGVSVHTIRRELEDMHEHGVLRRIHGGAPG